jgi:hypothetical protein
MLSDMVSLLTKAWFTRSQDFCASETPCGFCGCSIREPEEVLVSVPQHAVLRVWLASLFGLLGSSPWLDTLRCIAVQE